LSTTDRIFRGAIDRRDAILHGGLYVLVSCCVAFAQQQPAAFSQFRPRHEMPGEQFVGPKECAECHAEKSRSQSQTAMRHALGSPADSSVLQSHPRMTFRAGIYFYEISTSGQQSFYRVSNGNETISEPIAYVFGIGHIAQTYVLRRNGKLYEGRVSYYSGINGLDWTIGDAMNPPPSLEEAFGRDINSDEARNCFSCHGTSATADDKLQLDHLIPGVTCEACHGPGVSHVALIHMIGPDLSGPSSILDPAKLDPDTLSQEFCGSCHRSANTVGMMPDLGGINNVRFQPYRMSNSRGHDTTDAHFACIACHDPHVDLKHDAAFYDSNCKACHALRGSTFISGQHQNDGSGSKRPAHSLARRCKVADERCVTCHMPKVELPGAHFKFTDHRIRIARSGEPYPY